ncbi:MAG TPA: DUF134 domain-containing protein [Erysipelotrichaceae bacterium]|nr:DUF134 domain-containing protein [Erysipelotrichaceae bacterium]
MPRPRKWRNICRLPRCDRFGPHGFPVDDNNAVIMTVDEYEAIRLIDLERLTQEECAKQMNVSRTTVQGIYDDARKKLADSLVNGKMLLIRGGKYRLRGDDSNLNCGRGFRKHKRCVGGFSSKFNEKNYLNDDRKEISDDNSHTDK